VKRDALDKVTGKMEEMFTAEGRQAVRQRKELARAPKGQEGESMTDMMKRTLRLREEAKGSSQDRLREEAKGSSQDLGLDRAGSGPASSAAAGGDALEAVEKAVSHLIGGKSMAGNTGVPPDPTQWLPAKDERLKVRRKSPRDRTRALITQRALLKRPAKSPTKET